jgi:hypothetical protein
MPNTSASFSELATALRARLAVIANRELFARDPAAHLEQLKQASERIESAAAQLPRPVNGELAHFLQGCSYHKALAWLERNGAAE